MIHIAYVMPIPKVDMGLPFFARFPDGVDRRGISVYRRLSGLIFAKAPGP
jgi:hypothetical protein